MRGDEVSTKEKLIERLKRKPNDMTFQEMKTLLESLGFTMSNKGKTSGSRVSFMKGNIPISFHKPHGGEPIKAYVLKAVLETLERMRLI